MTKIDKTQYIGITETSDPCFHLNLGNNIAVDPRFKV